MRYQHKDLPADVREVFEEIIASFEKADRVDIIVKIQGRSQRIEGGPVIHYYTSQIDDLKRNLKLAQIVCVFLIISIGLIILL